MSEKSLNKSVKLYRLARGQTSVLAQGAGPELTFVDFKTAIILKIQCWIKLINIKMLSSLCPAGCDAMWSLLMQMKH